MTKIRNDIERVAKIIEPYGGQSGAHMAFIMERGAGRQFVLGGAPDLLGIGIAQIIAQIVELTPGLDYTQYISAIDDTARCYVEANKHGKG